mmetsp:Transcript_31679/g.57683  ORF Transcript_31679/g.57683 Transcript_31679/m.57683 type:complete len:176 (-) Transcript_31679:247-774(-)
MQPGGNDCRAGGGAGDVTAGGCVCRVLRADDGDDEVTVGGEICRAICGVGDVTAGGLGVVTPCGSPGALSGTVAEVLLGLRRSGQSADAGATGTVTEPLFAMDAITGFPARECLGETDETIRTLGETAFGEPGEVKTCWLALLSANGGTTGTVVKAFLILFLGLTNCVLVSVAGD